MLDEYLKILNNPFVIIGVGGLIITLTVFLVYRNTLKKKYRNAIDELEKDYNLMRTSALSYNVNKAVALAQMSSELKEVVNDAKKNSVEVETDLKNLNYKIVDLEDDLELGKFSAVKKDLELVRTFKDAINAKINKVNQDLAIILEQESQLRLRVNKLKDIFRDVKQVFKNEKSNLVGSYDLIYEKIRSVELLFEEFENAMSLSEFNHSNELIESIGKEIKNVKGFITKTPEHLHNARNVIPRHIRTVEESYKKAISEGCYLAGLQVESTLMLIKEKLSADVELIKTVNSSEIEEHFNDYNTQLSAISTLIQKEYYATLEVKESFLNMTQLLKSAELAIQNNELLSERVYSRYGQANYLADLQQEKNNLALYKKMLENLEGELTSQTALASSILLRIKELEITFNQYLSELQRIASNLTDICRDEDNAREQLIKLDVVINQVLVSIVKNNLPSISETFEDDLLSARARISSTAEILEQENLDVDNLNLVMKDTTDFIYRFYNDVNHIVGLSKMAEDTIVFCNRFRSTYSDIDSDLSKAEIYFSNGEYSNSLGLSLPIAQKIYPDTYAALIKRFSN